MRTGITAVLLIVICFNAPLHAEETARPPADVKISSPDLCSDAGPVPNVTYEGRNIAAPRSDSEKEALIRNLQSSDRTTSHSAATALGLAGDIEAFEFLIEKREPLLIGTYALSYRNEDGTVCVAPEIQDSVERLIDDRDLGPQLLRFFTKNLHTSRAIFDSLYARQLVISDFRTYSATARAIAAANIPGIEDRVLEHARRYPNAPVRETRATHGDIQRIYIDYFVRRQYTPAVEYLRELLDAEDYETTPERFLSDLAMRRRVIYNALDTFPSEISVSIFISRLERLTGNRRDIYYNYEFESLGTYSIRHAVSREQLDRIAVLLSKVLSGGTLEGETSASGVPGGGSFLSEVEFKIRKNTIRHLGEINTGAAGNVMISELQRIVALRDNTSAMSLVAMLLAGLVDLPEDEDIDIPGFLRAAPQLDTLSRFQAVPAVLASHPHEEGHRYLLTLLREAVLTQVPDVTRYGLTYERIFFNLIENILVFDSHDQLDLSRDELDRLFEAGNLGKDLYMNASEKFNELLGNESPLYAALKEKQRIAEEQRRAESAQQTRTAYDRHVRGMIDENTSSEGIRHNIQLLAGPGFEAKRAGGWLVIAGDKTLPHAHGVLEDPAADPRLKFRLIEILGAIGDKSSIRPIVEIMRKSRETAGLQKEGFLALARMPITDESFRYAAEILDSEQPAAGSPAALVFLALQRDLRGLRWLGWFLREGTDPSLKAAALFLAARVNLEGARERILTMLRADSDRSREETLLRALAEVTSPDEFRSDVQGLMISMNMDRYKTALNLSRFYHSSGAEKEALAETLLAEGILWDRIEAIRYLLTEGNQAVLGKYVLSDPRVELPYVIEAMGSTVGILIIAEARKMGYTIEQAQGRIIFRQDRLPSRGK